MGWQWHQLDHMQTICTSLQTDNHTSSFSSYRPDYYLFITCHGCFLSTVFIIEMMMMMMDALPGAALEMYNNLLVYCQQLLVRVTAYGSLPSRL